MKNSLQSWFHPKVEKESLRLIKEVIDSNFINDGPLSKKFSEKLNKMLNRRYSTCMPSATAGLFTAIKSLCLNDSDAIIIPSFSFIATANSAYLATPNIHFVDIDKNNFCIDNNKLEIKIIELKKRGIKVGAVISVEVNGRCPDYEKLLSLKNKYGFKLITDSAESLGSQYNNMPLGSIGDISVISLSPNKVISSGQGGVIFTNNLNIYKKIFEKLLKYVIEKI
jgi:perosamine synthetase